MGPGGGGGGGGGGSVGRLSQDRREKDREALAKLSGTTVDKFFQVSFIKAMDRNDGFCHKGLR